MDSQRPMADPASIPVCRTIGELRSHVAAWRRAGETVGLVPTMGSLHDGHLQLVRRARAECRRVVVTLFVNPTQFGPNEDLAAYPRDEAGDREKLAGQLRDLDEKSASTDSTPVSAIGL